MSSESITQPDDPTPRKRRNVRRYVIFALLALVVYAVLGSPGRRKPSRLGTLEAMVVEHSEDRWLVIEVMRFDYRSPAASPSVISSYESLLIVRFDSNGVHQFAAHIGEKPFRAQLNDLNVAVADGDLFLLGADPWQWDGNELFRVEKLPENSVAVRPSLQIMPSDFAMPIELEGTDFVVIFRGDEVKQVYLMSLKPGAEWEHHIYTMDIKRSRLK